jgi:hypothetical protein
MPPHLIPHLVHFAKQIGGGIGVLGAVLGAIYAWDDTAVYGPPPGCVQLCISGFNDEAFKSAVEIAIGGALVGAIIGCAIAAALVGLGVRKETLGIGE